MQVRVLGSGFWVVRALRVIDTGGFDVIVGTSG